MTNEFLFGFGIGMTLALLVYKITYHLFWARFKRIGRERNLKTERCKNCRNFFYVFKWESTKLCGNCTTLRSEQNDETVPEM